MKQKCRVLYFEWRQLETLDFIAWKLHGGSQSCQRWFEMLVFSMFSDSTSLSEDGLYRKPILYVFFGNLAGYVFRHGSFMCPNVFGGRTLIFSPRESYQPSD